MAVALLALLISASGAVAAAIPNTDGTIKGCYSTKSGALRVVDSGQCARGESALTWKNGLTGSKVADSDLLDGKSSEDFALADSAGRLPALYTETTFVPTSDSGPPSSNTAPCRNGDDPAKYDQVLSGGST
jgi:hypothetical protein